jgi:hypothetical protein
METVPDLVRLPEIAELIGEPLGTLHSWRVRAEHKKLPPEDAIVSGVPVWLKARWTAPGEPLPHLPYVVGVKEIATMFNTKPGTVRAWYSRGIGAPEHAAEIGTTDKKLRVWTVPGWIDFAERTKRPIRLPDDYQP